MELCDPNFREIESAVPFLDPNLFDRRRTKTQDEDGVNRFTGKTQNILSRRARYDVGAKHTSRQRQLDQTDDLLVDDDLFFNSTDDGLFVDDDAFFNSTGDCLHW